VAVHARLCQASEWISRMAQMVINRRRISRFCETNDPCIVQVCWQTVCVASLSVLFFGCSLIILLKKNVVKDRVIVKAK
jgi:hypothetical protein